MYDTSHLTEEGRPLSGSLLEDLACIPVIALGMGILWVIGAADLLLARMRDGRKKAMSGKVPKPNSTVWVGTPEWLKEHGQMANGDIAEDLREMFESSKLDTTMFVGSQIRELIIRASTAERRLAAYNSGGFADADAMASAYLALSGECDRYKVLVESADHENGKMMWTSDHEHLMSALEWKPITAENLPKVGDEVWSPPRISCFYPNNVGFIYNPLREEDLRPYRGWIDAPSHPFTHFRPINMPAKT